MSSLVSLSKLDNLFNLTVNLHSRWFQPFRRQVCRRGWWKGWHSALLFSSDFAWMAPFQVQSCKISWTPLDLDFFFLTWQAWVLFCQGKEGLWMCSTILTPPEMFNMTKVKLPTHKQTTQSILASGQSKNCKQPKWLKTKQWSKQY